MNSMREEMREVVANEVAALRDQVLNGMVLVVVMVVVKVMML